MTKWLWWIILVANCLSAQVTLQGNVIDDLGAPLSGASVVVNEVGTENIIAYDITDSKGLYKITFSHTASQIDLQVRAMDYATFTQTVNNQSQTLNFQLVYKPTELKEIVAEASPITRKGDTLKYNVGSFAKVQDRTIADVLKRMPGMEVLSDGKILYEGKPINKYYIEGLDLLEGKYNLANENLPHKEVTEVQVLENHQPIKILDSIQFSDNAALNIKLKNAYTVTGQAEVASGFAEPFLWDVNATPMIFTKKQQMLTSYQTNNIGDDISQQLKVLTLEEVLEQFENQQENQDWLSIQALSPPRFSKKRWLDNNAHLLTANYLHKLKKEYEVRLNVSYLNDYQQQNGSTLTEFYIPTDTISLFETQYNQLFFNNLSTILTLHRNAQKNYFKNSLEYQGNWDGQRGTVDRNGQSILQNVHNHQFQISNKLKMIFPWGNQLLSLKSYTAYNKVTQTLKVQPGQFTEVLNQGADYDEVLQNVALNAFQTHNYIGFTKGWKHWSVAPKLGFQIQNQELGSGIHTSENFDLANEFKNHLQWFQSKLYAEIVTQYKKDKWRWELTTPVNTYHFQIKDKLLQNGQDFTRITFEPRTSVIYDANSFWKLSASGSFNNQFGRINQLYYSYILQNYRTLQRMNTSIPETQTQSYSGGISYRNPIKSLFWNLLISYNHSRNNLLFANDILANGANEIQAIEKENDRQSQNISTRLSKYINKWNTNISVNGSFEMGDFQQILNEEITDIRNRNWGIGGKVEIDITDWWSMEYKADFHFSNNQIQNQDNRTVEQQSHILNLNFYPKDNQFLALKSNYIRNNLFSKNSENLFADLVYRYTFKKQKIDLELSWNNIFNTEIYQTINVDAFRYVETRFNLRPSQVMVKVRFSL